jgi:F420-non-reducing hydrogenase iron-sulfur subunit
MSEAELMSTEEAVTESAYEPNILGFLCNWCSYAGADLAGVSRIQYPPNMKVIRVMCSGRIDPGLVLEALINGLDGVIITGCHIGDCHYDTGNHQTERRYNALVEALAYTSFEPGRIRLEWVSASEGTRFGEVISSFTDQIKQLGPNRIRSGTDEGRDLLTELRAVQNLFETHASRTLLGKQGELTEKGNVYHEKIPLEEFGEYVHQNIEVGYIRNYILVSAKTTPRSVHELAGKLGIGTKQVVDQIAVLLRKNQLAIDSMDGSTPKYLSIVQEDDA